jgi:peptidyl-prolyl cis-trans isomerase SurA
MEHISGKCGWAVAMLAFAGGIAPGQAPGQAPAPAAQTATAGQANQAGQAGLANQADPGVVLDRVVAVVNGDLILESDVDEERRFEAFQPFTRGGEVFSRGDALRRLIDRTLILQQARLQPGDDVTEDEVKAQLDKLRKEIPACRAVHCETDAGWEKFVAAQGFTLDELNQRWKERMEVLKFIEMRFRMGIRIPQADIETYYNKTLLPQYAKQNVPAPKLDAVSDRIQEILLQQQVGNLLDEWLKSLRAQGSVRLIKTDEVTP